MKISKTLRGFCAYRFNVGLVTKWLCYVYMINKAIYWLLWMHGRLWPRL